jgi:hypothetical protein
VPDILCAFVMPPIWIHAVLTPSTAGHVSCTFNRKKDWSLASANFDYLLGMDTELESYASRARRALAHIESELPAWDVLLPRRDKSLKEIHKRVKEKQVKETPRMIEH